VSLESFNAVAKEWGPWVAILVLFIMQQIAVVWFFVRQTAKREERMGKRLDEQQATITTTLLATLKDNAAVMESTRNATMAVKVSLDRSNEILKEYMDLRQKELQRIVAS
jgi:hypothetical protein